MKKFCLMFVCIIVACTQFGCGGSSSSESNPAPTYTGYSDPGSSSSGYNYSRSTGSGSRNYSSSYQATSFANVNTSGSSYYQGKFYNYKIKCNDSTCKYTIEVDNRIVNFHTGTKSDSLSNFLKQPILVCKFSILPRVVIDFYDSDAGISIPIKEKNEYLLAINETDYPLTLNKIVFANGEIKNEKTGLYLHEYFAKLPTVLQKNEEHLFGIENLATNSSQSEIQLFYTPYGKTEEKKIFKIDVTPPKASQFGSGQYNTCDEFPGNNEATEAGRNDLYSQIKNKTKQVRELIDNINSKEIKEPVVGSSQARGDFYGIFGFSCTKQYTCNEIKNAYRKLSMCHPDRVDTGDKKAAEEAFVRINNAYEYLEDKFKC